MNCPIRTDPSPDEGHNQNPSDMANEINTNNSLNHRRNSTHGRRASQIHLGDGCHDAIENIPQVLEEDGGGVRGAKQVVAGQETSKSCIGKIKYLGSGSSWTSAIMTMRRKLVKFTKFIGPGFMVSVAYIDPGNYATDVAAGASFRFRLLFMILVSNIFAIFLQSLCIKLGTVTGLNLAENCKAHLPRWLNYVLYFFAESAIIATDIAEVIGTAIALNVLINVPLVAGCAISIVDVLIILFFYSPTGMSMRALRIFEFCVALLVIGVVVCFCFQLSLVKDVHPGEVFRGYLPSSALVTSKGLYQSCGILGATVMPHSLYLGSGIVQNRLRDFDAHHPNEGRFEQQSSDEPDDPRSSSDTEIEKYRPSLAAIKSCLNYSILELAISLFTFALFVNSSILIVAGASLSNLPEDQIDNADLFSIHDLLSESLAPAAGTIFALALLLSGTSAGIVCTIAGQMVSEGQLNWTVKPWVRRIITRSISITPSIIIAGAVGRSGLSNALEATQVCLSIILPFVSAPLLWFTCRSKIMSVWTTEMPPSTPPVAQTAPAKDTKEESPVEAVDLDARQAQETQATGQYVVMRNSWVTAGIALVIWGIIVIMNVALLVLVGMNKE
jgi:metal iron transporter